MIGFVSSLFARAEPAMSEASTRDAAAISALQPCKAESLDFLMSCFERAIEAFGHKLHSRASQ